jgi:hypothetical protein
MPRAASRPIVLWSGVVLALLAAHDLSHALDAGLDTSLGALALVAVPQWIVLAVVMGVIVRGDAQRSALAALLLGIGVVAGFAAVHLLPFSPAGYWDLAPSALSWLLVFVPLPAGLVLAALALQQLRASPASPRASASPAA